MDFLQRSWGMSRLQKIANNEIWGRMNVEALKNKWTNGDLNATIKIEMAGKIWIKTW